MNIKILSKAFFIAFFICILLSFASVDKKSENIKNKVLRLHVIAASDSIEDQSLKLRLRDEILKEGKQIFSLSQSKTEAKEKLTCALPLLRQKAQSFVKQEGYTYPVRIKIEKAYFPTKSYKEYTLPAGEYEAVRVIIGEGKGKNWWCVMFPPLCLPAASEKEIKLSDILNSDEMSLVKGEKYQVRLWIAEKWEEFKNSIKN